MAPGSSRVTEHTENTRRALHVRAKGQHCRTALPGGAPGRRKDQTEVGHHGGAQGMFCSLVTSVTGATGPPQRGPALNQL